MKAFSGFISQGGIGFASVSMALIFLVLSSAYASGPISSSKQRVGGSCVYKQYKGDAEIVSVIPRTGFPAEYEIKFSFHPHETIQEEFAQVEGNQWLIVQKDSSYPKDDFLTQYYIKAGKRLQCYMKVITKGTCTPVLFDFPTISNGKAQ